MRARGIKTMTSRVALTRRTMLEMEVVKIATRRKGALRKTRTMLTLSRKAKKVTITRHLIAQKPARWTKRQRSCSAPPLVRLS